MGFGRFRDLRGTKAKGEAIMIPPGYEFADVEPKFKSQWEKFGFSGVTRRDAVALVQNGQVFQYILYNHDQKWNKVVYISFPNSPYIFFVA